MALKQVNDGRQQTVSREHRMGQDMNGAHALPRMARNLPERPTASSGPDASVHLADEPWIRLYRQPEAPPPAVVPSPVQRRWYPPNAYHCTPMLQANRLGWSILTPIPIQVAWDGGETRQSVKLDARLPRQVPGFRVMSWFGHGIISISMALHLRTSPDVDVLGKDVPNVFKDGARVLEGMIETDWYDGTFLVSIKLTRPDLTLRWEVGEPICQIVPYPRGWIERFQTEVVSDGPDHASYVEAMNDWLRNRMERVEAMARGEDRGWDTSYLQGRRHDGGRAPESHQQRLNIASFSDMPPAPREL
jgi:hypothetical protein